MTTNVSGNSTWEKLPARTTPINDVRLNAIETAINGRAAASHTHTASEVSDATTVGHAVMTAADAAAARTAIGAAASADVDTSGQFAVNTVASSGATLTLPATHAAHHVTLSEDCTLSFGAPIAGHAMIVWMTGAYTPTWPAAVVWAGGTEPTYTSGMRYSFATLDGGTTWIGDGAAYS